MSSFGFLKGRDCLKVSRCFFNVTLSLAIDIESAIGMSVFSEII